MGPKEKISRSVMMMVQSIRDAVAVKLFELAKAGTLKLEPGTLQTLLAAVDATIDTGHRQSERVFDRELAAVLSETEPQGTLRAARLQAETGGSKKKQVGS